MNLFDKFMIGFISIFVLVTVYIVFVIFPATLYTENQCLKQGYPQAKVSIFLDRYCVSLDGVVQYKVDKQ